MFILAELAFLIILQSSVANAVTYPIDPDALKYTGMKISLVSPEGEYLNLMTTERVRNAPHGVIESHERGYISQVFATLPIDKMKTCKKTPPQKIFLAIQFSEEAGNEEFLSDGISLFSRDYKLCAPVDRRFLENFDLRARLTN